MVSGGGQLPGSCHVLTRWKGQGSPLGSRSQGHTLRAESSQSPRLLVPPPWGPEKAVTCREEDWGGPGDPGPLSFRSWGGPAAPARTAQSRGHVSFKAMAEKPRGSHCPTGASASPTSSRAGGTPAAKPPCLSCFCWERLPSGRSAPQTVTVSGSSSVCLGPGPTPRYAHTQGTQDPSAWREKPAPGRNGLEAARRPPWGRRCLGTGALARLVADMMGRPGGGHLLCWRDVGPENEGRLPARFRGTLRVLVALGGSQRGGCGQPGPSGTWWTCPCPGPLAEEPEGGPARSLGENQALPGPEPLHCCLSRPCNFSSKPGAEPTGLQLLSAPEPESPSPADSETGPSDASTTSRLKHCICRDFCTQYFQQKICKILMQTVTSAEVTVGWAEGRARQPGSRGSPAGLLPPGPRGWSPSRLH